MEAQRPAEAPPGGHGSPDATPPSRATTKAPRLVWLRRFRMLIGIYAIAVVVGVREFLVARTDPVDMASEQWSEMADVVARLNPEDPDTDFLQAMRAMQAGDEEAFLRHAERALAADVKHNDVLLRAYAQNLLNTGQDWRLVNWAVNRWRRNHPASAETLALPLGSGPRDEAEEELLRRELARVSWIADSELERYTEDGGERWRVLLTFLPPRAVDLRQAVEATTFVSLSAEQRARFTVRCSTLTDCTLAPRPGT